MEFDFGETTTVAGRIVFVLCLDAAKMKERILVGDEGEIRLRLEKSAGDVYYDKLRPLGQMLIDFESDPGQLWNTNVVVLRDTYAKALTWLKHSEPGNTFLRQKYKQGDPVAMYAAIRTWEEYLRCYYQKFGPDRFMDSAARLYRPFHNDSNRKPWQETEASMAEQVVFDNESKLEIWYPNRAHTLECATAQTSFQPVLQYYLRRLAGWKLTFQQCKICGRYFLAKSRRYELCSTKCRAAQSTENKRQFDERAKEDGTELAYENTYTYWYNRMKKLRKNYQAGSVKTANPEGLVAAEAAFAAFKAEGIQQKHEVKKNKSKQTDYIDWLLRQRAIIDDFMEG